MGANPWTYLDAPDLTRLDLASIPVHDWIGMPYLVGSCLERPDYRDVDVRCILADERFDALFPAERTPHPLRHLIEATISEHYHRATGLRVDFQIQRRADANKKYPDGRRHPLGLYPYHHTTEE